MPQNSLPQETRQTSHERPRFLDGMVVHAEDLDAAVAYPLDIFRTLVRAFFGCGVVCGLEVRREKPPSTNGTGCDEEQKPTLVVRIDPGVALDCHGYPLEICRPVLLDLEPRSSSCAKPEKVCIAIRRITSDDVPRPRNDCRGDTPDDPCQYTRVRDHVQIKVFDWDDLPRCLCMYSQADCEKDERNQQERNKQRKDEQARYCDCMKTCGPCTCASGACCDSWVLLACVTYEKDWSGIQEPDLAGRRYVKPIECLCRQRKAEPEPEGGKEDQSYDEGEQQEGRDPERTGANESYAGDDKAARRSIRPAAARRRRKNGAGESGSAATSA